MNRYSLIFAMLVATSFAVHSPQAGDGGASAGGAQANATEKARAGGRPSGGGNGLLVDDPATFIQRFTEKAAPGSNPAQNLQILFATVPHPAETHLAAAFDHNVDALQDGLQEAGYLFDSSLIPWNVHGPRDSFDDDEKEKNTKKQEDDYPGVLLFRKHDPLKDPYANGIVVFLLSEKPTEGIRLPQVKTAVDVLNQNKIQFSGPIRILGPSFSGSFASLVPVVKLLQEKNPNGRVLIRSGAVTVGKAAVDSVKEMASRLPNAWIDFGSAAHENADWIHSAVHSLKWIGIDQQCIATLSEGESLYGQDSADRGTQAEGSTQRETATSTCAPPEARLKEAPGKSDQEDLTRIWRLGFPRDISSLRAGYEQQGIFNSTSPTQLWKRALNLKSDEQNEGDSVRSFGGAATVAAQESVLFGISEFLKAHGIRAVIISATNEEDRIFLTQFLHAHNGDVRVVVIGNTRLFMRGSTAQFRGDLMVDGFPMLPRLHDWTGTASDRGARIFADDVAQGTYFAAIDLFKEASEPAPGPIGSGSTTQDSGKQFKWYTEYTEPYWNQKEAPVQRPPMYVGALGGDSTWPIAEHLGPPLEDHTGLYRVEMPFLLFEHDLGETPKAPRAQPITAGHSWKELLLVLTGITVLFCVCFWYANPVSRVAFASFAPSSQWRFWVFKVGIPAVAAGGAFRVLAWSVEMPANASPDAAWWWHVAQALSVLAPLGIVASAGFKAMAQDDVAWKIRTGISLLIAGVAANGLVLARFFRSDQFAGRDVGSILNTYREMHWESGLSLIPTGLFFLLAIMVWAVQAGSGAALLSTAPPLPDFHNNDRISQKRANTIQEIGRPLPFNRDAKWLWFAWAVFATGMLIAHFYFRPFVEITTLESRAATNIVRGTAGFIGTLIFLDVLQFFRLWDELSGMLRALDREGFKRSFVPISDFKWRNLWSFTGISFRDRRAINGAQIDCVLDLARKHGSTALGSPGFTLKAMFGPSADTLEAMRNKYNTVDLDKVLRPDFIEDGKLYLSTMFQVGAWLALVVADRGYSQPEKKISTDAEAIQRALACQCKGNGGRFSDEAEDLARLPEWQQSAERLLCLIYIGFIQTVIARLHTLLISIAAMFSLVTLGIAIYPFEPFSPLALSGFAMLLLIGWAFFKVFSEMDTDPILSRIVNGDDRKLQSNFYLKYAEALALPLLALGSSILPGGSGRLLELAQAFLNHSQ